MSKMIDTSGNTLVNVTQSVLPTGAATGTKQDTGNTSVASIDTKTPALVSGRVPVDGSGVTQPVSGTVSANLNAGTNNIGDVDVLTVPADPFGANADAVVAAGAAGSIQAKLRRATQGLEDLKTGIVLAAGANAVGKLAANSGVDIGDVDILSVTPGTGATNLGKAEDAAHTSSDVGVMALAVRRDANTSLVDATGDYAPMQVDANGNLKVAIITGAGSGGTAAADNSAFTPGTTNFTPIGGEVDDTATSDATENSAAAVRMTVKRAIHVNLRDNTGAEVSVGGGTQYDEDTVSTAADKITMAGVVRKDTAATLVDADGDRTQLQVDASGRLHVNGSGVTQPVSGTVSANLNAGTNNIGDVDVLTVPADPFGANADAIVAAGAVGSIQAKLRRATQGLEDLKTGIVLAAGSAAIGKLAANSGVVIGDVNIAAAPTGASATQVQGTVAHDGVDAQNPVKVGGKANTALPTAVAAADRTDLLTDVYGRPFVRAGHQGPAGSLWTAIHEPAANTQATISKAAAGAGVRNVCTGLTVTLAATSTAPAAVQLAVRLRDGATAVGTVIWAAVISVPATAGVSAGITRTNLWIPGTANTALTLEFSAAGGANTIQTVSMEGTTVAE
jgi:hypothetical protein